MADYKSNVKSNPPESKVASGSGITFEVVSNNKAGARQLKAGTVGDAKKEPVDQSTILLLVVAITAIGVGVMYSVWPAANSNDIADSDTMAKPSSLLNRDIVDPNKTLPSTDEVKARTYTDSPRELVKVLQLGMPTVGRPHGIVIAYDPPFWHQRVMRLGDTITVPLTVDGNPTEVEFTLIFFTEGVAIFRDPQNNWHRLFGAEWWDQISVEYGWRGVVRKDELVAVAPIHPTLFLFTIDGKNPDEFDDETRQRITDVKIEFLDAMREKLRLNPKHEQSPKEMQDFFRARGLNIEAKDETAPFE